MEVIIYTVVCGPRDGSSLAAGALPWNPTQKRAGPSISLKVRRRNVDHLLRATAAPYCVARRVSESLDAWRLNCCAPQSRISSSCE